MIVDVCNINNNYQIVSDGWMDSGNNIFDILLFLLEKNI